MATVNLLVWNIQTLGPNKFDAANGVNILNTVTQTAVYCGATIIGVVEIIDRGFGFEFGYRLTQALAAAIPGSIWHGNTITTNSREAYLIVYRMGQGFDYIDAIGTNLNAAGAPLQFPSTSGRTGGRNPGAFLFQTTDRGANVYFTVILYHAPGPSSTYVDLGIENIPYLGPVTSFTTTDNPPVTYPVTASFIGGDFNVNALNPNRVGAYANAYALGQTAVPVALGDQAKSSLTTTTPPGGYPNTVDYRAKAYDNIFARHPTTTGAAHGVVDLINLIKAQPGAASPALINCGAAFITGAISYGHLITSNPLNNNDDAWHVYRYGLSDHLPVFGQYTV